MPHTDVARKEIGYRGFRLEVRASAPLGVIVVVAKLRGGPQNTVREFGSGSREPDVHAACEATVLELCRIIDDFWSAAGAPAAPAPSARSPGAPSTIE